MKKSMNSILSLVIIALLLTSCGAESDILSQFSKRKYLKKSKATKQYELATANEIEHREKSASFVATSSIDQDEELHVMNEIDVQEVEVVLNMHENTVSTIVKDNSTNNWAAYNRVFTYSPLEASTPNKIDNDMNQQAFAHSSRVSEVLIAVLCIFIPPLAVFLYEDAITTNFWIDLIATILFWIPGIIVAFLICFGGVSF